MTAFGGGFGRGGGGFADRGGGAPSGGDDSDSGSDDSDSGDSGGGGGGDDSGGGGDDDPGGASSGGAPEDDNDGGGGFGRSPSNPVADTPSGGGGSSNDDDDDNDDGGRNPSGGPSPGAGGDPADDNPATGTDEPSGRTPGGGPSPGAGGDPRDDNPAVGGDDTDDETDIPPRSVTRERADPTAQDDTLNQLIGAARDAVDDPVQNAVENTGDAVEEVAAGDFAQAADDAAGTADERIQNADFSRGAAESLTGSGGLLSETRDDTGGVIPGETTATIRTPDGAGGFDARNRTIDTSEERVSDATQAAQESIAGVDFGATIASPADPLTGTETAAADDSRDPLESAVEGTVTGVSGAILGAPTAAETATETVQNIDETTDEFGAATVAETGVALTRETTARQAEVAQEDPARFAGTLAGDLLLGAGAGRIAGTAGRAAIDRSRTIGSTRVDPTDIGSQDVIDGDERFPGFDDEALAQEDPAAAVRQQSAENTPSDIERALDLDAGSLGSDEADVVKALDQRIEDPEGGDDFGVPDAAEGEFESPGSFVGPELSPNFLRIESPEDRQFSVVPGLPDISGRPTGAVIRTRVENPDADTLDEFNQELRDREGEQTAVTKPTDEVNPGEAEAVVPPGTQFQATDAGRADFFTEIDGRRVPIRTFSRDRDGDRLRADGDPVQTRTGTGDDGIDDRVDGDRLTAEQIDDLTERVDPSRRDGNLSPVTAPVGDPSTSRQRDLGDRAARSVFGDRDRSPSRRSGPSDRDSSPSPSPSPSASPSPSPSASPSPGSSGGIVSSLERQLFGSDPSTPGSSTPSSPPGGSTSTTPPSQAPPGGPPPGQSTRTPRPPDPDDDELEDEFIIDESAVDDAFSSGIESAQEVLGSGDETTSSTKSLEDQLGL